MSLRRAGSLLAVLALAACTSVTQEPQPADLVFATFSSPTIPTPNDLALAQVPGGVPCTAMPDGQSQLLCTFLKANGFPADQEVPVSIPLNAVHWDGTATAQHPYGHYVAAPAPTVDLATVTASTVTIMRVDVSPPGAVAYDAVASPGLLTLRKKAGPNGRRWDAGARYAVAVRGGPSGVKTTGGLPINADSAVALVIPNKDLTLAENQPLRAIPDANGNGTNADEIASLEALRAATWQPLGWSNAVGAGNPNGAWKPVPSASITPAFVAIGAAFPIAETATIATFGVAPSAGPVVYIDAGSGVAPLPIDLLRTSAGGKIDYNAAFGPAAAGLATLDGFSTTAMILAQTSVPVDAGTVHGANVHLYRLPAAGAPVLLKELKQELGLGAGGDPAGAGYVAEPSAIVIPQGAACPAAGGCSPAIGLQPAVRAPVGPGFNLPPLEQNARYAVVITRRVKDVLGRPLVRPTVAKLLLEFTHLLKADGITSDVPGVGNTTAKALADMQAALAPLWGPDVLPAGTTKNDVVTAYTFKTQSITATSAGLAGLPYQVDTATATPVITPVALTNIPLAAVPAPIPTAGVNALYDVAFTSIDAIDKTTGALNPGISVPANLPGLLTTLHALVVVPDPANPAIAACPPGYPPGLKCPKLVVFGHGLNGSKETLFSNAATLASHGFIAAAIDFPLHGGRNWCAADADCVVPGTGAPGPAGSCDKTGPFAGSAGQGDAVRPGVCAGGTTPSLAASRYFIGANFFRSRDAFRQNVLDVSALTLALNRPPPPYPQPAANPLRDALGSLGLAINPIDTYYEGISLGSIAGTSAVAANPRISRALFSVGGGTVVDVFTTSPAFHTAVGVLFASLIPGFTWAAIDPADPAFNPAVASAYLQTINVAKWILDPGDPVNYARHLVTAGAGMPDFLADPTFATPQVPKEVQGQVATLDGVVPNLNNYLLYGLMGANVSTYVSASAPGGAVPHGMLGTIPSVQVDAAGYLRTGTPTAPTITLP